MKLRSGYNSLPGQSALVSVVFFDFIIMHWTGASRIPEDSEDAQSDDKIEMSNPLSNCWPINFYAKLQRREDNRNESLYVVSNMMKTQNSQDLPSVVYLLKRAHLLLPVT